VNELRVHVGAAFRVIYVAKLADAVYVLHAFQKKSQRTARLDIELARSRFKSLMNERRVQ
jgi:phage-related protein